MVVKNKQTKNNLEQKQNSAKIISSSSMQDFINNNIIITIYFYDQRTVCLYYDTQYNDFLDLLRL